MRDSADRSQPPSGQASEFSRLLSGGGGLGFCIRPSNFGAQDFETTVLRMTGSLEPWYTPHSGTTGSIVIKRFYSVGCSIIIVISICIITGILLLLVLVIFLLL